MNSSLKINTALPKKEFKQIKKIKQGDTMTHTVYSPASVVDNIDKLLNNSNKKHIWKNNKFSNNLIK